MKRRLVLQLPGARRERAGIVGAVVAGLDRSGEMTAERRVAGADLRERRLDRLRHHQPSPFGVRSGLPTPSAEPERADDLLAKGLVLGAETGCAERIVESNGLGELFTNLP